MPKFLYKAKNNKSQIVTGSVTAQNQDLAEKALISHGLIPTQIVEERVNNFANLFVKKVSVKDRAVFSRQLSTMLSAGLALTKAISILARQAKNEQLKNIFLEVYHDLEQGYSFSSALAKHPQAFDKVFVSVVGSGESSGKLDMVLSELADQLENDSNFNSKVKSALYYPAFIFVVLIAAAIFMLIFVIPKLKGMFEGAGQQLPLLTRMLLAMSDFAINFWWLLLIIIFAIVIGIKSWLQTDGGQRTIKTAQMKLPGFKNINEGIYMYRFTRIMSMLIGAGVPLLDALHIGASVMDNVIYEESLKRVAGQVEKGVSLSAQLLKEEVFPQMIGNMVAVGEETGELDTVLGKMSDYYKQATNDMTKAISSLVEPAVLVLVGVGVAFIVFAIYMPIYQINSNIG